MGAYKFSNKKTRSQAGKKWRRLAKQRLIHQSIPKFKKHHQPNQPKELQTNTHIPCPEEEGRSLNSLSALIDAMLQDE